MKLVKHLGRVVFVLLMGAGLCQIGFAQSKKKEPASAVPDWGQFRGPNRDGLSPDTGLLKQWPAGGPALAWKSTGFGGGFSSVVVAGKVLYTLGDTNGAACLIAVNTADGKILWKSPIGDTGGSNGPGPRSTPATDGVLVFGLGQQGTLVCVQAATGRELWRKNMRDFGGEMMSGWGYSESPLIDGQMLVVTPGGSKGTVAALNKATGAPVWQSGELKDKAPYSSLVPVTYGNIPQYVVYTDRSVAGIVARTGQVAWRADCKGQTAVASTPVLNKEGQIFVSSAYDTGHNAFQVSFAGGQFRAQEIYKGNFQSHHGGMVLVGDHIYGMDGFLKCIEIKTGKVVWTDRCVGKGSITYADGHLYCRSETKSGGAVALVEATPTGYKETGRFTPPTPSGVDNWANPVVFGGKLYLRDQDQLFCYDVKAK